MQRPHSRLRPEHGIARRKIGFAAPVGQLRRHRDVLEQHQCQHHAAKHHRENPPLRSQDQASAERETEEDLRLFPQVKIVAVLFGGQMPQQQPGLVLTKALDQLCGGFDGGAHHRARRTEVLNGDERHKQAAGNPGPQQEGGDTARMHFLYSLPQLPFSERL